MKKRCFLPALALSLVIPDICAKYDYPNIYDKKDKYKGHAGQGAAYAKWYDENIGNYDADPKTHIPLIDGRGCWKLRCEFLHCGSVDLDDFMSKDGKCISFRLISSEYSTIDGIIGGCSGVSYSADKKKQEIDLDIANFCGKILAVLRESYLSDEKFLVETEKEVLNYFEY